MGRVVHREDWVPALARHTFLFHVPPAQYGKLIGAVPPSLNAHPREKVLGHLIILHNGNKEAVERDVNKWFDGEAVDVAGWLLPGTHCSLPPPLAGELELEIWENATASKKKARRGRRLWLFLSR